MNLKKILITSGLLLSLVATGCEKNEEYTSEDIVTKTLDAAKQVHSYYAEGTVRVYEGKNLVEDSSFKEWCQAEGRKRRVESTANGKTFRSVNDGKRSILYQEGNDTAYQIDITDDMGNMPSGQKDQMISFLDNFRKTHQIDILGEEKVLNYDTYHVKATPKSKETLLGTMEFFVEQKTWQVLKSTMISGDTKTEVQYSKFDQSPTFDDNTFKLVLPQNVKVQPMESANPSKKVTLEQAKAALGVPFLYWNDQGLKPSNIELIELKGELNRNELTLSYMKDNKIPYFTLSIFPTPTDEKNKAGLPEEKKVNVRGTTGYYLEQIRSLSWDENGLRYNVLIEHPDVSLDEIVKLTENMHKPKDK